MKNIVSVSIVKEQEINTLLSSKKSIVTILSMIFTLISFSLLGCYFQFGALPVKENTFFENLGDDISAKVLLKKKKKDEVKKEKEQEKKVEKRCSKFRENP